MANALITPTQVTREALRILHQKCNFIGTINRQYDDSFARKGAKIGDTLKIRLPNQFVTRTGKVLATQDTTEETVDLKISTQRGVDTTFSSEELTLRLDDFTKRILEPAMTGLAAIIENDAMSMYKDVYQQINNDTMKIDFKKILDARKLLVDALAPMNDRVSNLNSLDNVNFVDATKGLFQDSSTIAKQYKEGKVGRTAGFDFYENTLWSSHARGAGAGYLVNGAAQTGASLIVDTGTGTINKGDIFTIANVFRVHPESKLSTGVLQQFVVTVDHPGGAGTLSISPAIITTGAKQNVNAGPADNAALTIANTASASHGISMVYQEGAFTFATADLEMPQGVHFAGRDVYDGISMRVVRAYDINQDMFPCRIDVLYGFKSLRPQLAARLANSLTL